MSRSTVVGVPAVHHPDPGFGPIDVQSRIRHQPETSLPGHKVARKVGEVAAALQHIAWVSSPHASTPLPSALHAAYPSLRSVIAWRENGWDVAIVRVLGVLLWGQCQPDPQPRGCPVCIRTLGLCWAGRRRDGQSEEGVSPRPTPSSILLQDLSLILYTSLDTSPPRRPTGSGTPSMAHSLPMSHCHSGQAPGLLLIAVLGGAPSP